MQVDPANVDGRKVETHEFVHSVSHEVNWSHVLGFLVLLAVVMYLGPSLSDALENDERRRA